jgi:hypothetical protein
MRATVTAVSSGGEDDLGKTDLKAIEVNFDGIVGEVDVPGVIRVGDEVEVDVFEPPVIERS